jgi:hypothetical protein
MSFIGDQANQERVSGGYPGLLTIAKLAEAGGGGAVDLAKIIAEAQAIKAECDRDGLRYYPIDLSKFNDRATKAQIIQAAFDTAAFAADIQKSLGIVWERGGLIEAEAGKA